MLDFEEIPNEFVLDDAVMEKLELAKLLGKIQKGCGNYNNVNFMMTLAIFLSLN